MGRRLRMIEGEMICNSCGSTQILQSRRNKRTCSCLACGTGFNLKKGAQVFDQTATDRLVEEMAIVTPPFLDEDGNRR